MKNSSNQLKIDSIGTDKKSTFIKSITILLILIFVFFPLAEIVNHLDYNIITYHSKITCISGLDSFEILSFKEIK